MSVTFYREFADVVVSKDPCCTDSDCPYCDGQGFVLFEDKKGSVNFSNRNSIEVLTALGVRIEDSDIYGVIIPTPEVLRTALKVQNTFADPGMKRRIQALSKLLFEAVEAEDTVTFG